MFNPSHSAAKFQLLPKALNGNSLRAMENVYVYCPKKAANTAANRHHQYNTKFLAFRLTLGNNRNIVSVHMAFLVQLIIVYNGGSAGLDWGRWDGHLTGAWFVQPPEGRLSETFCLPGGCRGDSLVTQWWRRGNHLSIPRRKNQKNCAELFIPENEFLPSHLHSNEPPLLLSPGNLLQFVLM